MINETLKERLPALPEGYRWVQDRPSHLAFDRMHRLRLQRKVLGIWITRGSEYNYPDRPADWKSGLDHAAKVLYNRFILKNKNKKEEVLHPTFGVTDE